MLAKNQNRKTNSDGLDERTCYEPYNLDLHCLQKHLSWSTGLQGLNMYYDLRLRCLIKMILYIYTDRNLLADSIYILILQMFLYLMQSILQCSVFNAINVHLDQTPRPQLIFT